MYPLFSQYNFFRKKMDENLTICLWKIKIEGYRPIELIHRGFRFTSINDLYRTRLKKTIFPAPFKLLNGHNPTNIYWFKVNNRNIRKVCEMTLFWSLLLTLNIFHSFF